ncbi:helix-turn-helix domain-containing protein [Akkermansiaceae bacterium]|nr:helix-turn-helix domain-containing protein [Akkermansiaceae bacterium]
MERKRKSKRTLAPRITPPECFCCGSASPWAIVTLDQKTLCRDQTHEVRAEVTQCKHCDAIITSASQNEALLEKTREAHCKWIKKTLQITRKKLKLPQREFAAALGISTATLSRALKADSLIDPSTEELLLFKIKELRRAQEIEELLNLSLDHDSYNHGNDSDPIASAADSNELALAA